MILLVIALSFRLEGGIHQLEQSPRPEGPYLVTPHQEEVFVSDDGVIVHRTKTIWPYFTSETARRFEPGDAAAARVRRRHPALLEPHERLSAIEWRSHDPLFGPLLLRIEYDWEGDRPVALRQFENGRVVLEAKYRDLREGADALPPPIVPARNEAPPAREPVQLVAIGENVDLIRNAGGPDYHSLLIRFSDHVVIVEAPRSEEAARRAIDVVRRRYPSLPIRDVIVTHHHYDHIAGLPAYAAEGVRIVTTVGNVSYLKSHIDGEIVSVPSGYGVADTANEMVVFDAGPTEHAAEVIVVWLPRQKILFQGDLLRYDPATPEPPRRSALQLAEFIRSNDLDVQTLAGVHGEPKEFLQSWPDE